MSSTANPDVIVRLREEVERRLTDLLDEQVASARHIAAEAAAVVEQVRALTLRGGKRQRASLVLAGVACSQPFSDLEPAVVEVSAAVELLQTYLLVHDDWMDGDRLRRGGDAVHVALGARFGSEQLGAAGAVLAGDFASALAQGLLAGDVVPAGRVPALVRAFASMQRDVILGQTLDITGVDDQDQLHDLKTGSYTVLGPLALGHALVDGSPAVWATLERIARPVGRAFQLRDDLLGVFGHEDEIGKPAGSDLRQRKVTAPVRLALERLHGTDRSALVHALSSVMDDRRVASVRLLLDRAGVRELIEVRIRQLHDEAQAHIDSVSGILQDEGSSLLKTLVHDMTQRQR